VKRNYQKYLLDYHYELGLSKKILYFGRMPIESVIRPLNGQISRGIRLAPSKFVPEEEGFEYAFRLG
jgi:hypothetical protein